VQLIRGATRAAQTQSVGPTAKTHAPFVHTTYAAGDRRTRLRSEAGLAKNARAGARLNHVRHAFREPTHWAPAFSALARRFEVSRIADATGGETQSAGLHSHDRFDQPLPIHFVGLLWRMRTYRANSGENVVRH